MASLLEGIVENANRAYELQLQVCERLRNRKDADPYQAGLSSLSSGIRFAAIFGTVSKSQPFFQNAWNFLKDARTATEFDSAEDDFNPETAYRRMRVFWGLSGLSSLRGEPGSLDSLRVAWGSLRPAFGDEWSIILKRRLSSGVEDLKSVSVVQLVFLALLALIKMNPDFGGLEASSNQEAGKALSLPILDEYRDLRSALGLLAVDLPSISTVSDPISTYIDAYRGVINLNSYENGLVAGFTFVEAWLLAVVREKGDFEGGAVRLFS